MVVRGDEVTLSKKELQEIIIECSAKANAKIGIDDGLFIIMQGLIAVEIVKEVTKNIFGEKNND